MKLFSTGVLLLCFTGFVFGQQTEDTKLFELTLEELLNIEIDIASKKSETIFETPSTVTVIDRNFLTQFNIKSVSEAVSLISGVDVQRTYLKREIPTIRGILQDHYSNKVLVLINGHPAWNAVTGEGSITRVDINSVERIEVLRGPASVLYGTNAYAGAINIVLKTDTNITSANFGFGSAGLYNAGASINFHNADYSLFASGNANSETGSDEFIVDENNSSGHYKEFLRHRNFTFSFKSGGHELFFNSAETKESFLGVEPLFASGLGKYHLLQGYLTAYNYSSSFTKDLFLNYNISYDYNERSFPRTDTDTLTSIISGYRITNSLNFNYSPWEFLSLELGGEYDWRKSIGYSNFDEKQNTILTDNNLKGREVYSASIFSQVSTTYEKFELLLGSRFVYNKYYKNDISSRAALVYKLNDKNSIKAIWGESYRAPSLFELYFENGRTVFGNVNLEPEKSYSVEIEYLTSFDDFFAQILFYYSHYDNKIFRVKRTADPNDKSAIYINGNEFCAKGMELEFKYMNASTLNAFVNYNFMEGDDGDKVEGSVHYNFRHVPKHTVSAGLSKKILGVNVSTVGNFTGATYGSFNKIEASVTLDINVGVTHIISGKQLVHSFSVKNVFDEDTSFPEFSRVGLNEIPSGYSRRISYNLAITF